MTVTLELTADMETRLYTGLATHDVETVRQVLLEAVEPTVEALITEWRRPVSPEVFNKLLDEIVAISVEALPPDWQGLSDIAVSREGIYSCRLGGLQ